MKLTTKGRFAVTAVIDIAINSQNNTKPISLNSISERQNISLSYLEQIFVKLRKENLVTSHKGPGGGYTLARDTKDINISQVINAVNENMDARHCRGHKNCKTNNPCLTHDLWNGLTNEIDKYLSKISLADVLKSKPKNVINVIG